MRIAMLTLGVVTVIALLAAAAVIYGGVPDVGATSKHHPLIHWALTTTRERAVERRANSVRAPTLIDQQRIERGFRGYREMCALCHTPPGGQDSPLHEGLNPAPPDLANVAERRSPAELFWVIENGIRMTGMPAWGPTHSEEDIWDLVAFVNALPQIDPAEYEAMDRRLPPGHGHGSHEEPAAQAPEHGHADEEHRH